MWRTKTALILSVVALIALGFVMLSSTSSMQALAAHDDAHFFVKRQAASLVVGLLFALIAVRINPVVWKKLAIIGAVATFFLLVAVLIPGVGVSVNGSRRWLDLGIRMQPSELAKISMVFLGAWWMSRYQRRASEYWRGIAFPLLLMGLLILLIFVEPDYGTTILLGAVAAVMLLANGVRISYLFLTMAVFGSGMVVAIMQNPVRMRRIIAFLNPDMYADKEAYQLLNALYAFIAGGWRGVGLGEGLQKRYYLPEAHTDFIFAIIGEELGMIATLGVLILFVVIFFCGLRIASRATDSFNRLVALGLTCVMTMQAALNIAVVTGAMPTKGIALPFISFGGTSMVVTLTMIGLLLAIANQSDDDAPARTPTRAAVRTRRSR